MIDFKKLFKRRVKTQDKELEQFRQLLSVPDSFDEGFNITSLLGTLFVAIVMVPGAMYMGLVAGMGIGGAAQWVTVILFVEVAKRANAKLSRAQLLILFSMSGMIMGGSAVGGAIWNQFFVRSDAAISTGIAPLIPNWVAPKNLDELPRTFLRKEWLPFIGLMLFREIFGRLDSTILGYGLFRLTSDIERLPFPMAPVGAQGILAISEQVEGSAKSAGSNVRWRVFCIGCGIGMIFGLAYMAVPTITGAFFDTPLQIFKIPFADFTPYTQNFLPATATGYSFDLGNVIMGMAMPFYSMVGSFVGLVFTFIMNPILYWNGMMPTWQQGDTTVTTLFANNVDFYFSFQIGVSLAIAFYGIYACVKAVLNNNKNRKGDKIAAGAAGAVGAVDKVDFAEIERISRLRGRMPNWLVFVCYSVTCTSYILVSGWLIGWHPKVMLVLFFFGFFYTPLISYVTARLEGLAGQVIEIPFITEIAFILSGYTGVKIWFLPIPKSNYGSQVVSYKHAELLGCKFTSMWKANFFLYPIIIISTLLFSSFIWSLAEIPSVIYPFTQEMWELSAKNTCLVYSSTLGEYSQFTEALGWGRFLSGFASAGVLMGILGWFGAPTMLFFGMVRGLGLSAPHSIIPSFIGALIGRYYFERKYGREWRKMILLIYAGFGVGVGLISMLAVGFVFLAKAVSTVSY
ncbi:MAG: peptide transporter [Kiritimatiellaeota bacterium]|nr:peptide transporter [Kiritimatiellota bacterium]